MINVKEDGFLLGKTDVAFENEGILNPAVIKEGNKVHIFYKAVRMGNYSTIGNCLLDGPLTIERCHNFPLLITHFDYESLGDEDPKIIKKDDLFYLT